MKNVNNVEKEKKWIHTFFFAYTHTHMHEIDMFAIELILCWAGKIAILFEGEKEKYKHI